MPHSVRINQKTRSKSPGAEREHRSTPGRPAIGNQAVLRKLQAKRAISDLNLHELSGTAQNAPAVTAGQVVRINRKPDDGFTPTDDETAAAKLKVFDQTVQGIADMLKTYKGPEAADFTEALASLQEKRKAGKIVFGVKVGGTEYAAYDNATGQIRIYTNRGTVEGSQSNLIHEAIHAVHANRFPDISKKYAEVKASGNEPDHNIAVMLYKWKAWTEYWAYRREYEYQNATGGKRDPDKEARKPGAAGGAIQNVRDSTGQDFDPASWNPPAPPPARAGGGAKP
jgi:hypothetical protein